MSGMRGTKGLLLAALAFLPAVGATPAQAAKPVVLVSDVALDALGPTQSILQRMYPSRVRLATLSTVSRPLTLRASALRPQDGRVRSRLMIDAAPSLPPLSAPITAPPAAPGAVPPPPAPPVVTPVPAPSGGVAAIRPDPAPPPFMPAAPAAPSSAPSAPMAAPPLPQAPQSGGLSAPPLLPLDPPAGTALPSASPVQMPAPPAQVAAAPSAAAISSRVVFAARSSDLDDAARRELSRVAERLRASPAATAQILAYAASAGSESDVRRLSLLRALQVRGYLIESGIASSRLNLRALGDAVGEDRADISVSGN